MFEYMEFKKNTKEYWNSVKCNKDRDSRGEKFSIVKNQVCVCITCSWKEDRKTCLIGRFG